MDPPVKMFHQTNSAPIETCEPLAERSTDETSSKPVYQVNQPISRKLPEHRKIFVQF